MQTKNIKISGVHGVGKTSVFNELIADIYGDEPHARIASYSEFRHKPPFEVGSDDFQRWFGEQMNMREREIEAYYGSSYGFNYVDYIRR